MENKTFSVLDKLIKIFSQKGNITPDEIQELKDYLIETNIVDSDEDADSWIRNYLNKKYPEVKILKLEETRNLQNMTNEQLRLQFLSGVITESEYKVKLEELNSTEKKDSLNEHYIAGGIVGVGAINNPFEGRKKESYEDAFEYFLSSKYNLNEAEAEVNEDEDELEEGKEVEEPSLYEGEEPLKDISDEEKAEYLVYMTGMSYEDAITAIRRGAKV
jgi:hypothetical protein